MPLSSHTSLMFFFSHTRASTLTPMYHISCHQVVVLLLDATDGIVEQDRILAERIASEGTSSPVHRHPLSLAICSRPQLSSLPALYPIPLLITHSHRISHSSLSLAMICRVMTTLRSFLCDSSEQMGHCA